MARRPPGRLAQARIGPMALACLGLLILAALTAWGGARFLVHVFSPEPSDSGAAASSTAGPGPAGDATGGATAAVPLFPEVDVSSLGVQHRALLSALEDAYADQPPGPSFSEGFTEPWAASFVSWAFRRAGVAFEDPTTGRWRIADITTLERFLSESGAALPAGSVPQFGDVLFFGEASAFGRHVGIVIGYDEDGTVTTVGGDQDNAVAVSRLLLTDPELAMTSAARPPLDTD